MAHIEAARSFNRSSAPPALSVLADRAMEHYRGPFGNPAMYTPLVAASLSTIAGLYGGRDTRSQTRYVRHAIYLTASAAGLVGAAFHLYNVAKRPSGVS